MGLEPILEKAPITLWFYGAQAIIKTSSKQDAIQVLGVWRCIMCYQLDEVLGVWWCIMCYQLDEEALASWKQYVL